jgi:phospholipase D1/2
MTLAARQSPGDRPHTHVLITAHEAFPAFEEAVLDAESELVAGFRIFDLSTKLRSPRGRAIGEDWFDLLLHKLRGGMSIHVVLSDFDPLVAESLHALTWRSVRMFAALQELAPPGVLCVSHAAMHPARLAIAARLALWPRVATMLSQRTREIEAMSPEARERVLRDRPGLAEMIAREKDRLRPKRLRLPQLMPVTHHQKVAVLDGEVVYCGGLDLNERRWDDWRHERPGAETWHDVQLLRRDPDAGAATRAHLLSFVGTTHRATEPPDGGGAILRTLSMRGRGRRPLFSPRDKLHEIEDEIIDGIEGARRLIYLESQFLRDRHVTRALARAARRNPSLELFLVLPAAPEDVAFLGSRRIDARFGEYLQARCVAKLRRVYGPRIFVGSPAQRRATDERGRGVLHGAPIIYVHAKVSLFDDDRGVISSANLNGRSMRWDTEFGVPLHGPEQVADTRRRLLAHWLGEGEGADGPLLDPERCVPAWRDRAARNVRLAPEKRRGLLLPYLSGPGRRFGKDLAIVPEEMV